MSQWVNWKSHTTCHGAMTEPIRVATESSGSKWGVAIKAFSSEPSSIKVLKEVEQGGCCYPPLFCAMGNNKKLALDRSYLWIVEGGIEQNHYAPQTCCCGLISIQAICFCCPCPGKDNISKMCESRVPHPSFGHLPSA